MLRRMLFGLVTLLVAATAGLAAQPAAAATGRPPAHVSIISTTHLSGDGRSITVRLLVQCRPVDGIQWEGFINATQVGVFAWGELPLVCDGRPHIENLTLDGTGTFTPGTAEVSAVIMDENTLDQYASDARTVKVVARPVHGIA